MRRIWMIKDASGTAIGYIQQTQNALRGRIDTAAAEKERYIWFFFSDGTYERSSFAASGVEYEWTMRAAQLSDVCITSDGVRIADTGAEARMRFAQIQAANISAEAKYSVSETENEKKEETETLSDLQVFPELRWPPPLCWPGARYIGGVWRENQTI